MFRFDHAVINVLGDMPQAAAQYRRLGFTLTPLGYHTLGSINHLVVFGDSYLELLGYAEGEREKRAEMWEHPLGLTGLAFRSPDAAALHAELQAAGIAVEPTKDFSRPVEIDGETRTASFRTFQLDRAGIANGRIFFCQHNTPELIWRPEWLSHPNGVQEMARVMVVARDPASLTQKLALVQGADGVLRAGHTEIAILDPAAARAAGWPELDLCGGEMRMIGVDFICANPAATADLLRAAGVAHQVQDGIVTLAASEAGGAQLRFMRAG